MKGEIIVPNIFKSTEMGKFMDWAEKNTKDKFIKIRSKNHVSYNQSTNQIHYKNVYDDDMINMVGELYKKDIETFNFDYNI
jgi:predicted HAD superfamily Cof-like phosphohydrolase